jgi:hypothetical protein
MSNKTPDTSPEPLPPESLASITGGTFENGGIAPPWTPGAIVRGKNGQPDRYGTIEVPHGTVVPPPK